MFLLAPAAIQSRPRHRRFRNSQFTVSSRRARFDNSSCYQRPDLLVRHHCSRELLYKLSEAPCRSLTARACRRSMKPRRGLPMTSERLHHTRITVRAMRGNRARINPVCGRESIVVLDFGPISSSSPSPSLGLRFIKGDDESGTARQSDSGRDVSRELCQDDVVAELIAGAVDKRNDDLSGRSLRQPRRDRRINYAI